MAEGNFVWSLCVVLQLAFVYFFDHCRHNDRLVKKTLDSMLVHSKLAEPYHRNQSNILTAPRSTICEIEWHSLAIASSSNYRG